MRSREQVEFDDAKIASRTSASVAGVKFERESGVDGGGGLRIWTVAGVSGVNFAQRLVILSSKYWRKARASAGGEIELGKVGGGFRQSRLSRAAQSFLGWPLQVAMRFLKYNRRAAVISLATIFAWLLKLALFRGDLSFLYMVSSLDRLDFSFFISAVTNGLCARERLHCNIGRYRRLAIAID